RQLVELHGGTVRAESAGKGHGTTFTVELPIVAVRVSSEPTGELPARAGRSERRRAGPRVLLPDRQTAPPARGALFPPKGCGATRAAGWVEEALEILAAASVDVLVSDLGLPGVDGYALIAAVREMERQQRSTPIRALALTAYAGDGVRNRAIGSGFDAHATK